VLYFQNKLMTTRFKPSGIYGLPEENIVGVSKVTRVPHWLDGRVDAVMVQDGGSLTLRRPDGRNVTIHDDAELGHASIRVPGETTVFAREAGPRESYIQTPIDGLGTVEYRGRRERL
jgi:hypothetical protein